MRRKSLLTTAVVVAVGVVAAGIAYAAIPGGDGTIQGCYTKAGGALRVVDFGSPCKNNEVPLPWNQDGTPGVSPTVAQLPPGDTNCPAGGAAITDAAQTTAYVCSGQRGQAGAAGEPFSGTFTSGDYSISVTATGIILKRTGGPQITLVGDDVTVNSTGAAKVEAATDLTLKAGSNALLKASVAAAVEASATATITGSLVTINGCGGPAARVGDAVSGGFISGGSATVCIGP